MGGAGAGGESVGGSAGEPPITPSAGAGGEAGASGAAGAGGAGGEPSLVSKQCANACKNSGEGAVDGAEIQKICDPVSKRCVDPSTPTCSVSDDCFPAMNFWEPCDSSTACNDVQRCITWQGAGYCANLNSDSCFPEELALTLAEFGTADSTVNVCVVPAACNHGACEPGCETVGCGDGLECGATSHLCECSTGSECPDSGVCGDDHLCAQCVTDDDCSAPDAGLDKCVNGVCGCSSASVCPDPTASATPVCE